MWLDQADGFAEIFRGYLPFYLFVVFPIFIIMSPTNPVAASHEFSVYRMQQYDLHSVPHGCRSASFNLEGRSLSTWSMSRHCVVAFIQDITIDQYVEIRYKAGALLLVLPKNITLLSDEQKDHIKLLELAMTQLEISIPVYFAEWNQDFEYIIKDLQHSLITDDKSGTALEAMFNTVSSNGYQIVVSTHTPTKMNNKPLTLHGKLIGRSGEGNTIIIAAHYDSSSVVPELSFGADSNASGAVAILELGRIFSRLYSTTAMRGGPTLVFMLTPTGHSLNYFATKKWLEEHIVETGDGTLVQDVSFVMCLDSISSGPLIMHVSKPPKVGSPAYSIKSRLGVPMVHKKINLADEFLAWHHERFSIKRMTAFTISSLMSHKDPSRNTFLDTPSEDSLQNIAKNIAAIARALASHIYNLTDAENKDDSILYNEALDVDEDSIKHWYKYLSSQPRSPQIVLSSAPNGLTGVLERALLRYMDVTMTLHLAEKREPEYSLYQPTRAVLYVYSVKPAVFDLLLTLAIIIYLTLVYFALQLFPRFYEEYAKIVTGKAKVN